MATLYDILDEKERQNQPLVAMPTTPQAPATTTIELPKIKTKPNQPLTAVPATPQATPIVELPNGKTKITTKEYINDFEPISNDYKINPFTKEMEEQALKDAENSTAFGLLMDERNKKIKQYEEKLAKNTKAAKYLAWTNLFTNLAKLGGWGYAPVVKEDNTHLFNAFNDVDNVRNMLEQTDDKYSAALTNAKLQYVNNARDTHNTREKAIYDANQKYVDAFNEAGLKKGKEITTTTEYDPNKDELNALKQDEIRARIKAVEARTDLTEQQKEKLKKEIEKGGKSSEGKPFYEFENKNDGYTYRISKSKAVDIENYLADIKNGKISGIDSALKDEVEEDLSVLERAYDADMKDAETLRIISKYLQKYPGLFRKFLNGSNRVKTTYNDSLDYQRDDQSTSLTSELVK